MKKIIVIGAGASGIAAAIFAKNNTNKVIVLEKNSSPLKKLLLTGAGRCNFFNENFNENFYNINHNLISKVISYRSKYLDFMKSIGLEFTIKNGYYYPYSKTSVSVQNALMQKAKEKDIDFSYNIDLTNIIKFEKGYLINDSLYADNIILAAGSKAYPNTGSDGSVFSILKNLDVKINQVLPALVQLKSDCNIITKWPSLRVDAQIKLFCEDKFMKETSGELQLTNYGISGICVLSMSDLAVKSVEGRLKTHVSINFLSFISNYDEFVSKRKQTFKDASIIQFFEGIINYKLLISLFNYYKIKYDESFHHINDMVYEKIKKALTSFELPINGYNDFSCAQVCQGGVDLSELTENFELKKYPGIYVVGETNDIHGDCGGYNLSYAFISGMIAGESVYNDKN